MLFFPSASGHAPFRDPLLDDQDGGGIPSELDEELDRASSSPPQSTFVPFQNEDLFDDQVFGKLLGIEIVFFTIKKLQFFGGSSSQGAGEDSSVDGGGAAANTDSPER